MNGGNQDCCGQGVSGARVMAVLLPGLFTLILVACLAHMAYCALQGQCMPEKGFEYAISAFAL